MNTAFRRHALITGASGAIGQAIGQRFLSEGYELTLVARNQERLIQLADRWRTDFADADIATYSVDVGNSEQVEAIFHHFKSDLAKPIHVLINAAGISGGGHTQEISDQLWLDVIQTNLNSAFFVSKALLRCQLMPAGGRIINIASTGGKQGVIYGAPYCAAKHGMIGLTKALGLELARKHSEITVNAVCPGFVESEMAARVRQHYSDIWGTDEEQTRRQIEARIPIERYVQPDEVAAMVMYLASPAAAAVTAQALNVCGGLGNY